MKDERGNAPLDWTLGRADWVQTVYDMCSSRSADSTSITLHVFTAWSIDAGQAKAGAIGHLPTSISMHSAALLNLYHKLVFVAAAWVTNCWSNINLQCQRLTTAASRSLRYLTRARTGSSSGSVAGDSPHSSLLTPSVFETSAARVDDGHLRAQLAGQVGQLYETCYNTDFRQVRLLPDRDSSRRCNGPATRTSLA